MTSPLRVLVVTKKTSWRRLTQEQGDAHVQALLERHDPAVLRMRASHQEHEASVLEVWQTLKALGMAATAVDPMPQPFVSDNADLVITIGGDGTLLSASHYVGDVPILGVNSAPSSSVGFFCGARQGNLSSVLESFLLGHAPASTLTRMAVRHNGRNLSTRVLNDALFCHPSPAVTSRYVLSLNGIREEQRSSGFWVGPAAGSTAAQHSAGGDILPLTSDQLQLVVREPYHAHHAISLIKTVFGAGQPLSVESKMHDGRLFLDGPHEACHLRLGDTIEFFPSDEPLTVVCMARWPSHEDRTRSPVEIVSR